MNSPGFNVRRNLCREPPGGRAAEVIKRTRYAAPSAGRAGTIARLSAGRAASGSAIILSESSPAIRRKLFLPPRILGDAKEAAANATSLESQPEFSSDINMEKRPLTHGV